MPEYTIGQIVAGSGGKQYRATAGGWELVSGNSMPASAPTQTQPNALMANTTPRARPDFGPNAYELPTKEVVRVGKGGGATSVFDPYAVEKDLRGEFQKQGVYKDYDAMRGHWQRIKTAVDDANTTNNGASDIAAIFSFMKMLDPTSVVRESEYERPVKTAAIPDWLMQQYQKAMTGEGLSPAMRMRLKKAAAEQMVAGRRAADTAAKFYRGQAKRRGVDPNAVFADEFVDPRTKGAGRRSVTAGDKRPSLDSIFGGR